MTSLARLQEAVRNIEHQRPDVDDDPDGYWLATHEINRLHAEIARESDKIRALRKATGFKVA